MQNRLKVVRKAKRKTQQEIAASIGINQNTYSYWENGKVNIDNDSLCRLSELLEVSVDFLIGRPYRITRPVEQWRQSFQEDYAHANQYEREYLIFLHGGIEYIDGESGTSQARLSCDDDLTQKIALLDEEDRKKASDFVSYLLTTPKYQPLIQLKIAARDGGIQEITLTDSQFRSLINATEVTDLDRF